MSAFTVSDAVLNANHENAQLSTGPRTDEGKARSSQNAIIHGAYSQAVLLPGDDLALYEALGNELNNRFLPCTDAEGRLYTEIHESTWRLNRIVSIERSSLFLKTELQMDPIKTRFADQISDPAIIRQLAQAEAYATNARLFGQLHREEKRLRTLVDLKSEELSTMAEQRQRSEERDNDRATLSQMIADGLAAKAAAENAATQAPTPNPVRSVFVDKSSKEYKRNLIAQMTKPKQYRS